VTAIILPGKSRRPIGRSMPIADPTLGFAFNFDHFAGDFRQLNATYLTELYTGSEGPGFGAIRHAVNAFFYAGVELIPSNDISPPYRLGGSVQNSTILWYGEIAKQTASYNNCDSVFSRDHGTFPGVWKLRVPYDMVPIATTYLNDQINTIRGEAPLEFGRPYLLALTTTTNEFRFTVDGNLAATFAGTPVINPSGYAPRSIREGRSRASGDGHWGRISYMAAWFDRAILDEELRELRRNPWQLFKQDPIRIYSLPTGAISINSITASNITQTGARITLGLTR